MIERKTLQVFTLGLLLVLVGTVAAFAAGQQEPAGDDEVFELTAMARYFGDRTPDMAFSARAASTSTGSPRARRTKRAFGSVWQRATCPWWPRCIPLAWSTRR